MLEVKLVRGSSEETICTTPECLTADEIKRTVRDLTGLSVEQFYIIHQGRLVHGSESCKHGSARVILRLLGGKGGFGSMLRAIGAQIEKTTNREACRDLSGRRLRDINEEKRLKAWIEKKGTREEEAAERKKRKLTRLCAQPRHEFKDKNYEKERSTLTEKVEDAVEEGFKIAMANSSGLKRKVEENSRNRKKLALDLDIDSDELVSSSDDENSDHANDNSISKRSSSPSSETSESKIDDADPTRLSENSTVGAERNGCDQTTPQNSNDNSNAFDATHQTSESSTNADLPETTAVLQPDLEKVAVAT